MPATSQRDYYEVLGSPRDADEKKIKSMFRTLAMKYHPDRNKDPSAKEKFKEITEAYAILSDPQKRATYDRGGFAGVAGVSPEDLFGGLTSMRFSAGAGSGSISAVRVSLSASFIGVDHDVERISLSG